MTDHQSQGAVIVESWLVVGERVGGREGAVSVENVKWETNARCSDTCRSQTGLSAELQNKYRSFFLLAFHIEQD